MATGDTAQYIRDLEEENVRLRQRVEQLEREDADIRNANAIHNDCYGRMRLRAETAESKLADMRGEELKRLEAKLAKVVEMCERAGRDPMSGARLLHAESILAAAKGE